MTTRYYKVDGLDIALRVTRNAEVKIDKWNGKTWEKAESEYSGIFSDDIPTEPIERDDETWKRLGLQK